MKEHEHLDVRRHNPRLRQEDENVVPVDIVGLAIAGLGPVHEVIAAAAARIDVLVALRLVGAGGHHRMAGGLLRRQLGVGSLVGVLLAVLVHLGLRRLNVRLGLRLRSGRRCLLRRLGRADVLVRFRLGRRNVLVRFRLRRAGVFVLVWFRRAGRLNRANRVGADEPVDADVVLLLEPAHLEEVDSSAAFTVADRARDLAELRHRIVRVLGVVGVGSALALEQARAKHRVALLACRFPALRPAVRSFLGAAGLLVVLRICHESAPLMRSLPWCYRQKACPSFGESEEKRARPGRRHPLLRGRVGVGGVRAARLAAQRRAGRQRRRAR